MKKKFLKVLTIILLLSLVGAGGYYAYKNKTTKTSVSAAKYALGKVTKTKLDITVEATGTVTGADEVNVFSSNTGTVQDMIAKLGGAVNKGDLFCKIDDDTTNQAVENARISLQHSYLELQALKNQLDDLSIKAPIDGKIKAVYAGVGDDIASIKSTYGGMAMMVVGDGSLETAVPFPSSGKVAEVYASAGQSVKKGDVLFKLDPKTINNNIAQKENDIKLAEKNLKDKEETLSKSTISTPISGIVTTLSVKNGEIVTNEKLIATITDTSKMQVTLAVDELDINKVQIGQTTTVKIDDIEGKNFTGTVESIAQSGTTTNNVTTYNVVVTIDNPEGVKIGMNANVSIAVQSKADVLTVPVEAIIEKNGKKYVMVRDTQKSSSSNSSNNKRASNNAAPGKLVEVKTGLKNKTLVEIISGVTEGETVMTELSNSTNTNTNSNKNRTTQGSGSGMRSSGMGSAPGK